MTAPANPFRYFNSSREAIRLVVIVGKFSEASTPWR